jgi:hypothetical protein
VYITSPVFWLISLSCPLVGGFVTDPVKLSELASLAESVIVFGVFTLVVMVWLLATGAALLLAAASGAVLLAGGGVAVLLAAASGAVLLAAASGAVLLAAASGAVLLAVPGTFNGVLLLELTIVCVNG